MLVSYACNTDADFDDETIGCSSGLTANATFAQVKDLFQGELLQIQEDLIIEGYVVSSDRDGNFFSVLHFQDAPENPAEGFQLQLDIRENHLLYPVGSKIYIKLKGLYLGQRRDVFQLGGTFAAFGTTSVGRLPALKAPEHLFVSCDTPVEIQARLIALDGLQTSGTNTLVQLDGVEVIAEEMGLPFAEVREETERTLKDCDGNTIAILNSGFSDFQSEVLPMGNGTITGVLLRENEDFFIAIRSLEDITFNAERCEELVTEFTSNQIFISELADPNNNADARFVELYNSGTEALDLNGWTLVRYTNDNTEPSSTEDLSGLVIGASQALLIVANGSVFEEVYGFPPDLEAGTNSPADSNGDDNLELVDPFGTVIDVFGVIGEDGTGTDHEFEDGRANRNLGIQEGNPVYTFSEWEVFNDTGEAGTTNLPQNAPEDFTPGSRN